MIERETHQWISFYASQLGLSAGQTAAELGISESTVRRHLEGKVSDVRKGRELPRLLDGSAPLADRLLSEHPYTAAQIFGRLKEAGYAGGYGTVKRYVAKSRPPAKKAYFKLSFAPGEAAQADFGSCGTVRCGNAERRLSGAVPFEIPVRRVRPVRAPGAFPLVPPPGVPRLRGSPRKGHRGQLPRRGSRMRPPRESAGLQSGISRFRGSLRLLSARLQSGQSPRKGNRGKRGGIHQAQLHDRPPLRLH